MVMTFAPSMQPFYRPTSQLSLDTSAGHMHSKYFEGEDSILDDSVLDHTLDSGLEMSPPIVGSRRDSFAVGGSLFSPKQEDWQPLDMQPMSSTNPFMDHSHTNTNPFMRMDLQPKQQPQHHHQQPLAQSVSWPMTATASSTSNGVATPTMAQFDGLPAEYDAAIFQRSSMHSAMGQTPFVNTSPVMMGGGARLFSSHGTANGQPMSASSSMQSSAGHLTASAPSVMASAVSVRKIPPQSPNIRSHNELRRGDGIRKKNARFDIPAERNLNNIDLLISQSTDEQEIKELKQQKRLLRNRQAALDSRQRKKQHTERLEDEKKQYTVLITDLEMKMDSLKDQVDELQGEKKALSAYIERITQEREEMICMHTNETGDLRKRISVLSNHIQVLEGAAAGPMSGMPGTHHHHAASAVYGDASGVGIPSAYGMGVGGPDGMDGLGLDGETGGSWDNVGLFGDMAGVEQQQPLQHSHLQDHHSDMVVKQEMQLVTSSSAKNSHATSAAMENTTGGSSAPGNTNNTNASEKSTSQSLIFLLFLFGAFAISGRQKPITRVPENLRAASASLLDTVFKDAGLPQPLMTTTAAAATTSSTAVTLAPTASASETAMAAANVWNAAGAQHASLVVEPSMLSQMSDELMQPTEQQLNAQLFSLTAAQYNDAVHFDTSSSQQQQQQQLQARQAQQSQQTGQEETSATDSTAVLGKGRRSLAEALASMSASSKADVYTRSLLLDQIPADVVRTFAQMVAESSTVQATDESIAEA